jgi:REP element-mobilizing transposase RayT
MFLKTLAESCKRAGFVVHSYVLMNNHYHLLLETPAGNLVAGCNGFNRPTLRGSTQGRARLSGALQGGGDR